MTAVFLKLLNMSLTASLLILAVLPIRLLMKKAPKWMTCLLWLMVAVALVCPVRPQSPMSVLPAADLIIITTDTPQADDTLPLVQEDPILIQDIIEQEPIPEQPSYVEIGSILWCMGMLALLGYAAFSWLRLKRRVAASIEIDKNVFVCDDIDTPFILGMIRPHIYLPSELDEITAAQVLTHERAHLARKDHWWKPLGYLLLTVHWFNPLVWVAYSLLCTDIELACDEKVIKNMDTGSKQAYSEALLRCSMPRHLIAACPLAFGEVGVKQRIKAVLHYKKPAFWVILIAVVVCVALCAGFLTNPVVKTLGELNNHRRDQFDTVAIGNSERYITIDTDLTELFDVLEQVEVHPVDLSTQPLDHVIVLSSDNMAWSAYLNFSADYSYLWISYDTSLSHKAFAPGQQSIWNTQGYEVLNPDILQSIDLSAFSSSSSNSTPNKGSDIILPFAIYPDMDGSFMSYEALYDAIKTASSEELQKQKNIVLIGVNTLGDTEYAAIRCGDAAYLSVYLLEYTHNQDGTVSISAIGNGAVAEHMGNYGYSMNYSMLSGRTLYWTTFADKRWATTADGTETDTTKTVPTDYTGFRFIWADLQEKEYPVEGSFFLAEVDSVIPPAIAIPMVGDTAITALGWRLP